MIYCKSLGRNFTTKEELFKDLKTNEIKVVSFKKAQCYKSAEKGQLSTIEAFLKSDFANKAGIATKQGFVYPVINTTRYMDDQDDVHFDGIWKKSLSEQVGKIYYLSAHSKKIDDVIAWPEDVRAFTAMIDWNFVGKEYQGQTEALIFEIEESKLQKSSALTAIKDRRKVQGSVSMIYVKINMGIDSTEKEYAVNKAYFDSKINLIANKDAVIEQGYFFGVEEAKINKEGSLVLQGSNDATEIIYPDKDAVCDNCKHEFDYNSMPESGMGYVNCPKCGKPVTQKNSQPAGATDKIIGAAISTQIDYSYLIKNLKN